MEIFLFHEKRKTIEQLKLIYEERVSALFRNVKYLIE